MSAPTPTARILPTGRWIGDGHGTLITIALDPDIKFWEASVTPPGIEGDNPIDNSTQFNVSWRTLSPRRLRTLTVVQFTANYDPAVYPQVLAVINVPTTITIEFPDGSTLAFYGYMKSFQPGELVDGTRPTATCQIQPTNTDPLTCEEEGPVYTAGTGTSLTC